MKITDLEEERLVTRHERNEFGELEKVQKLVIFKKAIPNLSAGMRLLNYLIDGVILTFLVPQVLIMLDYEKFWLMINSIYWLSFPLYYLIMEFFFQRTIGKMITGSVVINEYAEKPDFVAVGLRTIIRIVPFEALSFLNNNRGWHDRWTNTYVVKANRVSELQQLIKEATD